jgi:hypothetical protein
VIAAWPTSAGSVKHPDRENHYKRPGGFPDDVAGQTAHVVAMTSRFCIPIVAILLQGGCATTQSGPVVAVPSLGAEDSAGAIRAAEEVGAAHSPEAALHLELAKEQFEHSRHLTKADDRPEATRLLLRARADADLSLALTRENTQTLETQAALTKFKTLNESLQQNK